MKPNMLPEILECLHFYFEDNPNVEVDCLLYLISLRDNRNRVVQLSSEAFEKLEDMDRCPCCGELMQVYHYQEPHPELDGCPMENMSEQYCSNCDIGGVDY